MKKRAVFARGGRFLKLLVRGLPVFAVLACGRAEALLFANLSKGYSNCYFKDNGNGTTTASVSIDYKNGPSYSMGATFKSRGILVYAYDKNGKLLETTSPAKAVSLNGVVTTNSFGAWGYIMFFSERSSQWMARDPFVANISVTVNNNDIADWPAVGIRAGNYTSDKDVAEITGLAYMSRDQGGDGNCSLLANPELPPPKNINITVAAPDWDLGELAQGQSDTTLSRTDQQLCFSYSAADVQNKKFIIGASNANGVLNNRYQLRHVSDISQTVPYSLRLDSGGTPIQLPSNNSAVPLDGSGRTCFTPTFRTEVGSAVKEGDYSDVLTFTVNTKS